ncbi:phage nozzle protein [Marinobacter similis]
MGQLVSQDIPNLVGGVSQQAPSLRLPTQCSEQINCWNSVVEGLMPRPATKSESASLIQADNATSWTITGTRRNTTGLS